MNNLNKNKPFIAIKPKINIEVLLWNGEDSKELTEFCKGTTKTNKATLYRYKTSDNYLLRVQTPTGKVICNKGDYIVREAPNVFYVYTKEDLNKFYIL